MYSSNIEIRTSAAIAHLDWAEEDGGAGGRQTVKVGHELQQKDSIRQELLVTSVSVVVLAGVTRVCICPKRLNRRMFSVLKLFNSVRPYVTVPVRHKKNVNW